MIRSEKLSVVGKLATGVAHEIRNPLTSLKGFTQLLKSKYKDQSQYFDIMLVELERINLIVNDFMTLAKPQLTKFSKGYVDEILGSVMTILDTQAILLNINMITNFERPIPSVYCDVNQLKQVFVNLIQNAIESMPQGGEVKINVRKADTQYVCIQIQDNGNGIPPEVINRIGEPFLSTKETGTGLGIMISCRIIEGHHGTINFSSVVNKGTTVEILLPIV